MKKIMKNTVSLLVFLSCAVTAFVACQKDYTGKYDITDGNPTIYYVRPTDPMIKDSLLTGAPLGQTVCLVGENLTSVQQLFFNDQRAILNINLITKNTLIVTVPAGRSENITNKIYFVNAARDTTDYDFTVLMPSPSIRRIVCEVVPEGKNVVLEGDYFFDDDPEYNPIKVKIGGYTVPYANIVDVQKTRLTFKAPAVEVMGNISVTTVYGSSPKSMQIFRDDRGLITGFDEGAAGGWGRPAATQFQEDPVYVLSGKYLVFNPTGVTIDLAADGNSGYNNGMICNIWQGYPGTSTPLFSSEPSTSILRFEAWVVEPWAGGPMTFYFGTETGDEGAVWNAEFSRGYWTPWMGLENGYTSGGWETVSIPIANCNLNALGSDVGAPTAFDRLIFAVMNNSGAAVYNGKPSAPRILIDNIRVVPGE